MTSEEQCVMSCYYDHPGCLAVNVITNGDVITCEMTTGLSNETDMVEDSTSVVYVTRTPCRKITKFVLARKEQ